MEIGSLTYGMWKAGRLRSFEIRRINEKMKGAFHACMAGKARDISSAVWLTSGSGRSAVVSEEEGNSINACKPHNSEDDPAD